MNETPERPPTPVFEEDPGYDLSSDEERGFEEEKKPERTVRDKLIKFIKAWRANEQWIFDHNANLFKRVFFPEDIKNCSEISETYSKLLFLFVLSGIFIRYNNTLIKNGIKLEEDKKRLVNHKLLIRVILELERFYEFEDIISKGIKEPRVHVKDNEVRQGLFNIVMLYSRDIYKKLDLNLKTWSLDEKYWADIRRYVEVMSNKLIKHFDLNKIHQRVVFGRWVINNKVPTKETKELIMDKRMLLQNAKEIDNLLTEMEKIAKGGKTEGKVK